jgi:pimeloyl-ACP methyl ester carboxylesterase
VAAAFAALSFAWGCGDGEPADESAASKSAASVSAPAVAGERRRLTAELPGGTIDYTVVLPDGYTPGRPHPVLLAFPPGGQGREEVDALLDRVWEAEARSRGWIVVSPETPGGRLFFAGSEKLIPDFLDKVAALYPPEGGRFHLAGVSNGGLSAFSVALATPKRFASLLGVPGYPQEGARDADLGRLRGIPVTLFVGENDRGWREAMEETHAELRRLGIRSTLRLSPGEGHIITKIPAPDYWDALEAAR